MSNEALDWRELGAVKRERAAEILGGINPKTVDKLLREGALRGPRAGRCPLVSVQSLRAYLGEVPPLPAVSALAPVPVAVQPRARSLADRRILAEARRRVG